MARKDTNEAMNIADSLRLTLMNCDMRLTYGETQRKLLEQEFQLKSKLGSKKARRQAMVAKAQANCYEIYVENVKKIKSEATLAVSMILDRYESKYRRIWIMYFIERASYAEIMAETDYSKESIDKIVRRFKDDITKFYGGNDE